MSKKSFKRLLAGGLVHDVRREFLSGDEYLKDRLDEICCDCPQSRITGYSDFVEGVNQQISHCRRKYFGVLLESFLGKPGEAEIDRLYSYLERCEQCLMKDPVNTSSLIAASSTTLK